MSRAYKNVTVLLVEDNEVDVMGVRRAFQKSKMENPIVVAANGIEALDHYMRVCERP